MGRVGPPWGSGWSGTGALGWEWDHSCRLEACTGAQPLGEDLKIILAQRGGGWFKGPRAQGRGSGTVLNAVCRCIMGVNAESQARLELEPRLLLQVLQMGRVRPTALCGIRPLGAFPHGPRLRHRRQRQRQVRFSLVGRRSCVAEGQAAVPASLFTHPIHPTGNV